MTSVLPPGKYKQKKEWSASSIPELVSGDDESNEDGEKTSGGGPTTIEIQVNGVPQSFTKNPPRRSSLAVGLFGGGAGGDDNNSQLSSTIGMPPPSGKSHNKRRSSIAVAFLGRKDNTKVKGLRPISCARVESDRGSVGGPAGRMNIAINSHRMFTVYITIYRANQQRSRRSARPSSITTTRRDIRIII